MRIWLLTGATSFGLGLFLATASASPISFNFISPTSTVPTPITNLLAKGGDLYSIVAYGAQGGTADPKQGGMPGGRGAEFGGNFMFTNDTVLGIVVGGMGGTAYTGGGGGGSFVTLGSTTLLAAGGGGGATNGGGAASGGVTGTAGTSGANGGGAGGVNGGGGGITVRFISSQGGGGGGVNGRGGNGTRTVAGDGAVGGGANSPNATTPYSGGSGVRTFGVGGSGGFGGGGSGDAGGGGGGGYSGGGGGGFSYIPGIIPPVPQVVPSGGGGGGGSFLAPSAPGSFIDTASAPLEVASFQLGNGLVTIEDLSVPTPPGNAIPEPAAMVLLSSALVALALRRRN